MSERTPDEAWAAQAGQRLREAERELPDGVVEQLQVARAQALETALQSGGGDRWRMAGLGGAGAAAAALVVFVALNSAAPDLDALPLMDEAELAAAQEAELLEELEFLAWMVAQEQADATAGKG